MTCRIFLLKIPYSSRKPIKKILHSKMLTLQNVKFEMSEYSNMTNIWDDIFDLWIDGWLNVLKIFWSIGVAVGSSLIRKVILSELNCRMKLGDWHANLLSLTKFSSFSLLDNEPNYITSWVHYPKEKKNIILWLLIWPFVVFI